jgi:hypothetical protein
LWDPVRVAPDRQIIAHVSLGFQWPQTTTRPVYNRKTKQWENQPATEWLERACRASVMFTSALDQVYVIEYSNMHMDSNCTIQAYHQTMEANGSAHLDPVGIIVTAH